MLTIAPALGWKVLHGRPRSYVGRWRKGAVTSAAPSDVFVLGMDNVLVNSSRENVISACRAAVTMFPKAVSETVLNDKALLEKVVAINKEAMLTPPRLLAMLKNLAERDLLRIDALTVANIRNALKTDPGVSTAELMTAFLKAQEDSMHEDESAWLQSVEVFPGMRDTLAGCPYPFYITTGLSPKAASLIARKLLNQKIDPDSPRLFTCEESKRADIIRSVNSRPLCQESGARLHFIDSSLMALRKVKEAPELEAWKLYFALWASKDVEKATEAESFGATVLSLKDFHELLKWGILMGVDDGCEPTPEEVQAGVYKQP